MYNYPASKRYPTDTTRSSTPQENEPGYGGGYASTQEQSLSSNAFGDPETRDGANDVFGNGYMRGGGGGPGSGSGVHGQETTSREVHVSVDRNKIIT